MNLRNRKLELCVGTVLLGVWAASALGAGQTAAGEPVAKSSSSGIRPSSTAHKPRVTQTPRSKSSRRRRPLTHRQIRARLKPTPERIQEIQEALARAGYLSGEPSGKWDDRTREAMRRYQAANGFPATGLPEAKSLMKLGLGPHPLPADVDPSAQLKIDESEASDTGSASSNAEPARDPGASTSNPPGRQR